MNYHPLFVHFPIAFLTIYCLLEMVRIRKIMALSYWFYIKGVLVMIGTGATIPSFLSGRFIANFFEESLVEVHYSFALSSIILFGIISISYFINWMEKDFYSKVRGLGWWLGISSLNRSIFRPRILIMMSVIGLALITLTGALGGIIAFGPDADPITSLVYELFFGK